MHSPSLAHDYVRRAGIRLGAIDVLFAAESWADVVRECQEVVELALKGLLRTTASSRRGSTTSPTCSSRNADASPPCSVAKSTISPRPRDGCAATANWPSTARRT